jgi:putative ABC transport system substrate-binding protein
MKNQPPLLPARRLFLTALAGTVAGACGPESVASARQAVRTPRVALLLGDNPAAGAVFATELATLGYVHGRNLELETHVLPGAPAGAEVIAKVARAELDVLVVAALTIALEVRKVTQTAPLVIVTGPALSCNFGLGACPVRIPPDAARPRDPHVTGIEELPPGVTAKRLTLLKAAFPSVRRIALLSTTPGTGGHEVQLADAEQAADGLGVEVRAYRAATPPQLQQALEQLVKDGNQGLLNFQGGLSFTQRRLIIDFAAKHRLPAIYQAMAFPESGGLMAWAPDLQDQFRQAAGYVARILDGASAGDLPIRYPSRYYFVVNASTAKTLGARIPPDVLAQADRVLS